MEKGANPTILKQWLQEKRINFLVKVDRGDQYLCFDVSLETEIYMLYLYVRQQRIDGPAIYLSEALFGSAIDLKTKENTAFFTQFQVQLYHTELCYPALHRNINLLNNRSAFLPGSEWLYVEIYANPAHFKEILLLHVAPLLKQFSNQIDQWFFIHFNQPTDHIRLRLKLKDPQTIATILAQLNNWPIGTTHYDLIHQIQLKTYEREMERYGADTIELTESLFHQDSILALAQIGKYNDELAMRSAMHFIKQCVQSVYENIDQQLYFYQQMADQFAAEMKFNTHQFKQINDRYKHLVKEPIKFKPPNAYLKVLKKIMAKTDQQYHFKRLADFIHMHVNRRFVQNQRVFEAVIYQFLVKQTQRDKANVKHQAKPLK